MICNKINRIVWIALLLVSVIGIKIANKHNIFIYTFSIGTGIIFILDYIQCRNFYDKKKSKNVIKIRWHIFANFMQWLFWFALLYIPFSVKMGMGYKIFMIIDLFIISTFTVYKYKKY